MAILASWALETPDRALGTLCARSRTSQPPSSLAHILPHGHTGRKMDRATTTCSRRTQLLSCRHRPLSIGPNRCGYTPSLEGDQEPETGDSIRQRSLENDIAVPASIGRSPGAVGHGITEYQSQATQIIQLLLDSKTVGRSSVISSAGTEPAN